jgi:hypothetical protein
MRRLVLGLGEPNLREWDLQDVENWYETEGSIGRRNKNIQLTQKDREPLERICRALGRGLGIVNCPIHQSGKDAYQLQLPIEESANFVRYFKDRVKTRKAKADMEELERLIMGPSKRETRPERKRARAVLFSS